MTTLTPLDVAETRDTKGLYAKAHPSMSDAALAAERPDDAVLSEEGADDKARLSTDRVGVDVRDAEVVADLTRASFMVGSIVLADGGTEAQLRPDAYPTGWNV